ncbi:hypothetical protein RAB80_007356 [Fusarium oxysporum f. sp. vasinfectum]|nr:hypothetical protein RAB80_007356 [Fusarium oxysporum f. sp. vasinfectum]KAK2938729.1 hypothetical protein FoTM2_001947 [Fusarium oxysporum f. sp. vasinfectum]
MDYNVQIHHLDVTLDPDDKHQLQNELRALAALYIKPLPNYQIFKPTSSTSLKDKIVVVIRDGKGNLAGFVSAILIPINGIVEDIVLHSGITVIHENHRKSPVKKLLFSNLIMSVLRSYPGGNLLSVF